MKKPKNTEHPDTLMLHYLSGAFAGIATYILITENVTTHGIISYLISIVLYYIANTKENKQKTKNLINQTQTVKSQWDK